MKTKKIQEIKALAKEIDVRINLFEGYAPKEIASYNGELLFWRQIVNVYGLLADCDRVQIKEQHNLLELMQRYSLIERADYDRARLFWQNISDLRKWFCHNNDPNLYYKRHQGFIIKRYLSSAFILSSNKPEKIEEVQKKDWEILAFDIESRSDDYLDILKKGFQSWKDSEYFDDLINEWISIFSAALFADKELIHNVLADLAEYNIRNQYLHGTKPQQLEKSYYRTLTNCGFSESNITNELTANPGIKRSNAELLMACIRNSGFINT